MTRSWSLVGFTVPALLGLGALVLEGRTSVAANDQTDCEAARCAAQAAIDASCPCEAATTHGHYVRCVTRVAKDTVPNNCRGAVIRCAARSTCGKKEGAVTCLTPTTGKCQHPSGTCANDPSISCQKNKDCVENRCKIESSAAECEAGGGTVGSGTSCCAACPGQQTQCCVQSSAMGAFDTCQLVADSASCAMLDGIPVGTGTCEPNPCPPVATTSTTTVPGSTSTTTVTVTSTTTTTEAPIQCCVQGSAMGAFDTCTLETPAACATAGGIAAGPGTCEPNPCPPSTSSTTMATTSTTVATTSSTTETTATTLATTTSTEVTTTSTTTSTTFSMVGAFLDGLT